MQTNAKTLSDIIKEAKHKITEPQYIEGTNSYFTYYHIEKNGQIHWTSKEFTEEKQAEEFYLKKLQEYMYELSMPFYKQFKPRGGR